MINPQHNIPESIRREVQNCVTGRPREYRIKVSLYRDRKTKLFDQLIHVEQFTIAQNPLDWYSDLIILKCHVPPREFLRLIEDHIDLMCTVKIVAIHRDTREILEGEETEYTGSVLVRNYKELTDSVNQGQIDANERTGDSLLPVELELIDPDLYSIRKMEFNRILRDCTVRQTSKYLAGQMGFTRLEMVPPDNERVYDHVIVPPGLKLSNVSDWLQNAPGLGMYYNDCTWYYTQGILRVFPKNSTRLPEPSMNFYSAGIGNVIEPPTTYRKDSSGNGYAVISGEAQYRSLGQERIENKKIERLLVDDELAAFDWVDVGKDGSVTVPDHLLYLKRGEKNIWGMKDMAPQDSDASIVNSKGNPYQRASESTDVHLDRMAFTWEKAVPFAVVPGHRVFFHTHRIKGSEEGEEDGGHWKIPAVLEKAVYAYTVSVTGKEPLFNCNANIQLATEAGTKK